MKTSDPPQSATSLPRAPRADATARSTTYLVMMGIRIACLLAMILVTPYGWYSWLFAVGAVALPYIAVVIANVGQDTKEPEAQRPDRMLPAANADSTSTSSPTPAPDVIRVTESAPPKTR